MSDMEASVILKPLAIATYPFEEIKGEKAQKSEKIGMQIVEMAEAALEKWNQGR